MQVIHASSRCWTLAELLADDRADWSTLGMAIAALFRGAGLLE